MKNDGKKTKRLVFAAAAAAVLVCAGALLWHEKSAAAPAIAPAAAKTAVAYVPLDDRTDNTDYVEYEAAACGYTLYMPDRSLYATRLDGQGDNPNGTQYGSREALLQWVRRMDESGCNIFLISLDQLFSGGLVNSRSVSGSPPLRIDEGELSEEDAFDKFILALGEDKANRVYLFDSVMRLASTVGYQGLGLTQYTALREYGSVARKTLSGAELTLDNIFAAYPYGADGVTPAEKYVSGGPSKEIIEGYLAARERKLRLIDHVMDSVRGNSAFRLVVGVDDSAGGDNIHTNELAYIAARIGGGTLLPGMDSLARLQLARIVLDGGGKSITADVQYFGGEEDKPSSDYDNGTLRDAVDAHLRFLGAKQARSGQLSVLVLTAPAEGKRKADCVDALIGALKTNGRLGKPTILVDASRDKYGAGLNDKLLSGADFAGLMGYCGRYDQASVTGAALAMGFSRCGYLLNGGEGCGAAHVRQLANSMILSMVYSSGSVHYDINQYILSLGFEYTNIAATPGDMTRIESELLHMLRDKSGAVLQNLASGAVKTDLHGGVQKVRCAEITGASFPWHRSFEVSLGIEVAMEPTA